MTVNQHANPSTVVVKAFTWAYEELGWSRSQAAEMLSVSESVLARYHRCGFESDSVQNQIQLTFIRMYHLLYALSEGDTDEMQYWMRQYHSELQATPVTLCDSLEGLQRVTRFLESEPNPDMGNSPDHVLPIPLNRWE